MMKWKGFLETMPLPNRDINAEFSWGTEEDQEPRFELGTSRMQVYEDYL
jgi:outer membrane receptor for ferrienterochelin and colicin